MDGLGGSVRRLVWRLVKARKEDVSSAAEFYEVAKRYSAITMLCINTHEINSNRDFLDQRWDGIRPIPNLQKVHHVEASGGSSVKYAFVSTMAPKVHRFTTTKPTNRITEDDILNDLV